MLALTFSDLILITVVRGPLSRWPHDETDENHGVSTTTELSDEQSDALDRALSATSTSELIESLDAFEETLPPRSQAKREEIADSLVEEIKNTSNSHAKKLSRLLVALASIDTPNGAEIVAEYAGGDPDELGDRVPVWASSPSATWPVGWTRNNVMPVHSTHSCLRPWKMPVLTSGHEPARHFNLSGGQRSPPNLSSILFFSRNRHLGILWKHYEISTKSVPAAPSAKTYFISTRTSHNEHPTL